MADSPSSADTRTDGTRPAAERGGLWGLICSTVGLLILWYGIPLSLAGILLGRRARKLAKENDSQAPGAMASIVLGGLGIALWSAALTAYMLAYDEVSAWQSCLAASNTTTVAAECDQEFRTYLEDQDVPEVLITSLVGE